MRKTKRYKVHYPNLEVNGRDLIVERLTPERTDLNMARSVQSLLRSAYTSKEQQSYILPDGAAASVFSERNPRLVLSRRQRMREHMRDKGSSYWIVRDSTQDHQLVGLSKVTPLSAKELYVNDIAVREQYQRKGIGRALAYTALKHQTAIVPEAKVSLDAFVGTDINAWYEHGWGLEPQEDRLNQAGMILGDYPLTTMPYVSPDSLGLHGVLAALEAQDPRLAEGIVTGGHH